MVVSAIKWLVKNVPLAHVVIGGVMLILAAAGQIAIPILSIQLVVVDALWRIVLGGAGVVIIYVGLVLSLRQHKDLIKYLHIFGALVMVVMAIRFATLPTYPVAIPAELAIRDYYSLIQQGQYELAYEMLSPGFRTRRIPTIDIYKGGWEKSGPAIINGAIDIDGNGNIVLATYTLYYPRMQSSHRLRYELVRNVGCDNPKFDCWLITGGEELPLATSGPADTLLPCTRTLLLMNPPRVYDEEVKTVQQRLLELGYTEVGTADGYFGPDTESAVKSFQAANGLKTDGIVWPETCERLFSNDAIWKP